MLTKKERADYICTIREYGGSSDCPYDDECGLHCELCSDNQIEDCAWVANKKCNQGFAEAIGYGGYDTEDEFWESIFD